MKKNNSIRIFALLLALFFAVMPLTSCRQEPQLQPGEEELYEKLELLDQLFRTYTLFELDEEALMDAVLKGYIAGTGDKYAEYFNAEEYERFTSDNRGESVGIGINVTMHAESGLIEVLNVVKDSPAMKAGVLPGDIITHIGLGENSKSVAEVGYTVALDLMLGEIGSIAEFIVSRNGESVEFSVKREKVVAESVMYRICETDASVGIVKIVEFDLTTPEQFDGAVEDLLTKGCDKFIFDVRYNPGGDLKSIAAVLAYFLNEDDVYIRVADRSGKMTESKIEPVNYKGAYASCSIKKSDIGKYRGLDFAVLTNKRTASAAELFTSALMDYELSLTVGVTTYGKGTMQSTYDLKYYGYKGALKLTTKFYYPPISDSYEEKGIAPDVFVELDEALKDKNIYTITDAEDNQLGRAIEELYKKIS